MNDIPEGCEPFDLERALAGEAVVTRDGREARDIKRENGPYDCTAISARIENKRTFNKMSYCESGEYLVDLEHKADLFMKSKPAKQTLGLTRCEDCGELRHTADNYNPHACERAGVIDLVESVDIPDARKIVWTKFCPDCGDRMPQDTPDKWIHTCVDRVADDGKAIGWTLVTEALPDLGKKIVALDCGMPYLTMRSSNASKLAEYTHWIYGPDCSTDDK